MKIFVSVVIYNKEIEESITCIKLQQIKAKYMEVFIIDNSIKKNSNAVCAKKRNWNYINMNGNAGLSKAYNRFINEIGEESGVIVFLDDDTEVTQDYFDKLGTALEKHPECDIFSPTIIGQDGRIWSPNHAGFLKNTFVSSKTEIIPDSQYNAINSCTAVRIRVFREYRYDERLFLDQVDHKFYYDQRKQKRKFLWVDSIIYQNFSQMSPDIDVMQLWMRLKIRIKDITEYGKILGGIYRILAFLKCCGISLRLSQHTCSLTLFFKAFMLNVKLLFKT